MKPNIIGSQRHIHQYDLTNFKGRIFFTTDIHGHFDLLHEKLREVGFDSTKDILFVGGDFCDRGPDSKYILDYISEPWIHSVQANHEEMVIDYIEALAIDEREARHPYEMLYLNGGEWFFDCRESLQMCIYRAFKELPLAIEILLPDNIKVGIIHADCPFNDWTEFKNITKAEFDWNGKAKAQWSRTNIDRNIPVNVKGLDVLLTGHSPTKSGEVYKLGNQVYCDLGSFFRNKLAMVDINQQFIEWVKND